MAEPALNQDPTAGAFNGLKQPERTLESSWYFDPAHYQRELGLAGIDYCLLETSQPLEHGLMAYLMTRRRVL